MPPVPSWVKELTPSGPQGSELLAAEREKSTIPVNQLSEFLFTKAKLERKENILKILESEPVFDKSQNYFSGRVERFERALARAKRLQKIRLENNWSEEDFIMANDLISEPGPYGLHEGMFLVTLRTQGTEEQQKVFLTKAQNYEIIGCYAQTELGHGSNVRGLETTATWNQQDKTFTLHSPHLTAAKWWIGSLGKTANYASVMAQLIIDGKSYGPHPFVCQIRDLKTHEPLENICIGDIGPKFGYNTMDNGFLLFNKVKVPHISMLARFSRVDPGTGKYLKPSTPSLVYGTLTYVRSVIVHSGGSTLARGVTIAIRYCSIRRQFQDRDAPQWEKGENPVINYTMVQIRLLTLLATSFALHFTGQNMMKMYLQNQEKMNKKRSHDDTTRAPGPEETLSGSDMLADLHATSCGLKSLASSTAAEGLEACRKACGGHGYSSFSGIGPWYADYLPTITWEGDNYMLTQQVARYLLKSARSVLAGERPTNDTTLYMTEYHKRVDMGAAFDILSNDEDIVKAYAWRAAFLAFEALKHRDDQKKAWNDLLVDFYRLSRAHSQYIVVKSFLDALRDPATKNSLDATTLDVMYKLFRLHSLYTLEQEASEFYTSSACTVRQIQLARTNAVMTLLGEIRPHAVRLVDAWAFPDWQMDSSLGRADGKVYEDMFHRASQQNPLNEITIDPYPDSAVLFKQDNRTKSKL